MSELAHNRRAAHEYLLGSSYMAGISLTGAEVKSIRAGGANIAGAYCTVDTAGLWLRGMRVAPLDTASDQEPDRPRQLLLNRSEVDAVREHLLRRGGAAVPTRLVLVRGLVKVELSCAVGRQAPDKRQAIMARDARREVDRAVKSYKR